MKQQQAERRAVDLDERRPAPHEPIDAVKTAWTEVAEAIVEHAASSAAWKRSLHSENPRHLRATMRKTLRTLTGDQ